MIITKSHIAPNPSKYKIHQNIIQVKQIYEKLDKSKQLKT